MGRDVQNTLIIRGPKEQLDHLESTGLALQTLDPTLRVIRNLFFGPNATVLERSDHCLRISFMTRHSPPLCLFIGTSLVESPMLDEE